MTTLETEFAKSSLRCRRCEDRSGKSWTYERGIAGRCFCPVNYDLISNLFFGASPAER